MTPNEAPATTNYYALNKPAAQQRKASLGSAFARLAPLMADEKRSVAVAFVTMGFSALAGLLGPVTIAYTVDTYVQRGDFGGVLKWAGILLAVYLVGLVATYVQTQTMGRIGR